MYTVEKQIHEGSLWSVKDNLLVIADCLRESDARAIADAMNMKAAMGEVWEAAINLLSNTEYEDGQSTGSTLDCEALEKALAALDRAEGV